MGADYGSLGLNSQLQALDSLSARSSSGSQQYTTASQFEVNNEGINANSILSGNIKGVINVGKNNPNEPYVSLNGTADRIEYNDGTNTRFFVGNNNGTTAMKLSQAGNNVLTASDDNLILSSEFNNFKIVSRGTCTVSVTTTPYVWAGTITHNLGYYPSVISYVSDATALLNRVPCPYIDPICPDTPPNIGVYSYYVYSLPDTNKVKFTVMCGDNAPAARSVYFTYFLMREVGF